MTTYLLISINPAPGREEEFNDWYTNVHLGEVLQVEGILSAQRFRLADAQVVAAQPHRYLTVYEIEGGDTASVLKRLQEALPRMRIPPVSESTTTAMAVFDAITDVARPTTSAGARQGETNDHDAWMLVGSTPNAGMEQAFNDWYSNVHLGEVLEVAGFHSAQRFVLSQAQPHDKPQPYQYLALYAIDGRDTAGSLRRLQEALPRMQLKPVADPSAMYMAVFDPITERVTKSA